MNGYIVCCGTGNPLTSPVPSAICYTNFRHYRFAMPGEILVYNQLDKEPTSQKSNVDYGIVEIQDLLEKELVASFANVGETEEKQFRDHLITGTERAKAVAETWSGRDQGANYGAAYVASLDDITPELLASCRKARKDYGAQRLGVLIGEMRSAALGRKGRSKPTPADEAWASELGKVLPSAADLLADAPRKQQSDAIQDTDLGLLECPQCAEPIREKAQKCRYCGAAFGMPLIEFMTQPKAEKSLTASKER